MNVNPTHSERPLKSSRSVKAVIRKSILPHFWLSLVGVIFLLPFIWLVLTSLKSPEEMFAIPVKWLPSKPQWDNYIKIFQTVPFFLYIRNTLFLIVVNIIGTIISAPLVAYSITKVDWKGRNLVFMLIMATMILPPQVTMIPIYIIFSQLGWVNTYLPLTVGAFFGGAFNIFLLRQFLLGVPKDLSEAARIDGANDWGIFWKIMFPLMIPPLATIAIFTFNGVWNDFTGPLIYLNDPHLWTVALGLQNFQSEHGSQWGLLMAGGTIFALPSVIIYFIGQRYLMLAGTALSSFR